MSKQALPQDADWPECAIFTVGHSTLPLDGFIELLKTFDIKCLVDIRTVPRSRHNPQFNGDTLRGALRTHGIEYMPLRALGGLRHPRPDSPNTRWRNTSFRGYADYMQTSEFASGIKKLIDLASKKMVVIVCAEAVPWRCHRSLIGDALTVRGITVTDIFSLTNSRPHKLTSFAKTHGTCVTYPSYELAKEIF